MPELLPTRARAAAALATVLNWSCSFLVTETFAGLVARIGAAPARSSASRSCAPVGARSWRPRCRRRGLRLDEVGALVSGGDRGRRAAVATWRIKWVCSSIARLTFERVGVTIDACIYAPAHHALF